MSENIGADGEVFDEVQGEEDYEEQLPNFSIYNLKGDPELQYQINSDDDEADDINEYLDRAITSNLETLEFKWKSECLICSTKFVEYQDLFQHCIELHKNEFDEYACTLHDCDVVIANENELAKHLVLRHGDLESIQIYSNCPYCGFRCSNFNAFNKHSCYRKITRRACMRHYCQYCKEEFVSHKRFLFHLQFHLSRRRSKICLICNMDFNDVNEFFEHVNYAHEPPETLACRTCDRVFQEMESYKVHQNLHDLERKYKCDECTQSYHDKRLLMKHKEDVHSGIDYKCEVCGKIFPSLSIYETHKKWHIPEEELHVYTCKNCGLIGHDNESLETHITDSSSECFDCEVQEEILAAAFNCLFCDLDFKDKDCLRMHRDSGIHEDGKISCPLCTKEFEDLKAKRLHLTAHKNYRSWLRSFQLKRMYMCDEGDCIECYDKWSSLQRHKRRIHPPNTCQNCNQQFESADELQSHIEHCQYKVLTCQFCDKIFPTKMSLAVHVARRHYIKNVLCPHCSSAYKDEDDLKKHIDYCHVPVPCPQCDKVIKSKRYLPTHIRITHESEHRYFCSYCNKGFFHLSQKDLHEKTSHADSLYKCGHCKFKTKYPSSLEVHVAKHLRKLDLICPYCLRKFGRKNSLNVHIKLHENDKPFRCWDLIADGCDAAYVTRNLLNQHIKRKHSMQQHKLQESSKNVKSTRSKSIASKPKIRRKRGTPSKSTKVAQKFNSDAKESNNMYSLTNENTEETNSALDQMVMGEEAYINVDGITNNAADDGYVLLVVD